MAKYGDGKHNMKTWNITVFERKRTVFHKQCKDVKEASELLIEMREKYPPPEYLVLKEHF